MPLNNEVMVNLEDTNMNYDPFVAMSQDGHWLVVWTNDTNASGHSVYARLFDNAGTTLLSMDTPGTEVQHPAIGEPTPSAAFDTNNNFAISWNEVRDNDNIPSQNLNGSAASPGVYFREYSLNGAILRAPTNAPTAASGPATIPVSSR